ncbi:MAG: hypothetical protein AABX96_03930 [Nanoarchaeota archaeon]
MKKTQVTYDCEALNPKLSAVTHVAVQRGLDSSVWQVYTNPRDIRSLKLPNGVKLFTRDKARKLFEFSERVSSKDLVSLFPIAPAQDRRTYSSVEDGDHNIGSVESFGYGSGSHNSD